MVNSNRFIAILMNVLFIFFSFMIAVFSGVFIYSADKFNVAFESVPNFTMGNISFQTEYQRGMGAAINTAINLTPELTLFLIFGMIIIMLINAYLVGTKDKLLMLLDFVLLIFCFIFSVPISSNYYTFITQTTELNSIYINQLSLISRLIMNLPVIVTITGILIMVLTYYPFRRIQNEVDDEEY